MKFKCDLFCDGIRRTELLRFKNLALASIYTVRFKILNTWFSDTYIDFVRKSVYIVGRFQYLYRKNVSKLRLVNYRRENQHIFYG